MAGIDKLKTRFYGDYKEFHLWCLNHKPSLLYRFYDPFLSYGEWEKLQKRQSKNTDYGDDAKLIIAHFLSHEDRYLYWHCPLGFIRYYLETQCGYKKANWFVKLFWKY
jgi:hypothetical protein